MNLKYSKCLGLAAVLYFTANYSAQQVSDTTSKEKTIEEVVVIGYGTQKKSNVTGAISSIKASDIENIPAGKPEQVLQGRAAGVNVVSNSGQPGASASIRIRGITSYNSNNEPLWVVDGIVVDGIGWLSQSDIESIEVLKDGASSAIYGVSAARGVILVTTKKGKQGRLNLSYNGFYGVSNPARKIDLLNATQYATVINEGFINDGSPARFADPSSFGAGTDWQDIIFSSADRQNHEVNVQGGNEKSTFFGSFGYYDQSGIVMRDISYYKRLTARLNSTHKVTDWLTIGQTFAYTNQKNQGINANGEFGGPLSSAVNLDPITSAVITDMSTVNSALYSNQYIVRDPNGNPYGISPYVNQEMSNPLAFKSTQLGNKNWSDDFIGNVFAEVKFLDNLKLRSSLNGKKAYWGSQGFTPKFYLNPNYSNLANNSLNRTTNTKFEWSMENTLTYIFKLGEHNFNAMAGTGYYDYNIGSRQSVTYTNLPVDNYWDASFNFGGPAENRTVEAGDNVEWNKASYFGRLIYDFKNKYLFTGTLRYDGSSVFGANKHWGIFPSFSIGWNLDKENFWPENNVVTALKLRGGYGNLGNDGIGTFNFATFYIPGANYTNGDGTVMPGYYPNTLANPDLKWESTRQTNLAADMKLFRDFSLTVDVYNKTTYDILRPIPIPGYVGVTGVAVANAGDMENKGIEIEFGYKKTINDLTVSFNSNFSYNENKVLSLIRGQDYEDRAGFQSMGPIQRIVPGESYNSFYGFQTLGVFQNQSQIDAYVNSGGQKYQASAKPGDFIWSDANGDGVISDLDKVNLGNSIPKFNFGATLNLNYKSWDLMVFGQGAAGHKVFQGLRRLDILDANYQTKILDRWTGEGSTNENPRLTRSDGNKNYSRLSDWYLQNGDYFRIKLISLGYTLPKTVSENFGASKVRFYITGENVFTFTKYTGYDPEIAAGDSYGIDRAFYPQARTFMFGANITF